MTETDTTAQERDGIEPLTLTEACQLTVALVLGAGGSASTAYRCAYEFARGVENHEWMMR